MTRTTRQLRRPHRAEAVEVDYGHRSATSSCWPCSGASTTPPEEPPGPGRRHPVPVGDLRTLARAAAHSRAVGRYADASGQADRNPDHRRAHLRARRGVPPALLRAGTQVASRKPRARDRSQRAGLEQLGFFSSGLFSRSNKPRGWRHARPRAAGIVGTCSAPAASPSTSPTSTLSSTGSIPRASSRDRPRPGTVWCGRARTAHLRGAGRSRQGSWSTRRRTRCSS